MSNDNPSAFPNDGAWGNGHPEGGMFLRDYFAAQHMAASIERVDGVKEYDLKAMFGERTGITREEIAAALAYRMADAMMARRAR